MVLAFLGGGKALVDWHVETAKKNGVEIRWSTPAAGLIQDPASRKVQGVLLYQDERIRKVGARGGVILACGGFQASPSMRAQYLGPGWDFAHVRGCKYSTGDGHRFASQVSAKVSGNYSGCHAVAWDADSPNDAGDRVLTNQFTKSGYTPGNHAEY